MNTGISLWERLEQMGIREDCEEACMQWGVTLGEAFPDGSVKHSRSTPIVKARWEVFVRLAARGWSGKAIGDALGFHHTTVLDGLRRHEGAPGRGRGPRGNKKAAPSQHLRGGEGATGRAKESTTERLHGQDKIGGAS